MTSYSNYIKKHENLFTCKIFINRGKSMEQSGLSVKIIEDVIKLLEKYNEFKKKLEPEAFIKEFVFAKVTMWHNFSILLF